MSITKNHESHYVTGLVNPQFSDSTISEPIKFFQVIKAFLQPGSLYITRIPSLSKAFSLIGSLGSLDLKELANLCRCNLTPRGSSGNSSNWIWEKFEFKLEVSNYEFCCSSVCVVVSIPYHFIQFCHTWSSRFNFSCVVSTRLSLQWRSCCRVDWSNLWCFFVQARPCVHKNMYAPRNVGFYTNS